MRYPHDDASTPDPFGDSLERALHRLDAAYERAIGDLLQRYEAVDNSIMEAIGRGSAPPSNGVDALFAELGIRVVNLEGAGGGGQPGIATTD
ncbi:MAG: hypothetical protein H0V09_11300 [Gemmatimonadetes bacterium]|nr:hypothetical protein [Gemmatimonadota bacterium]